MNLLYSIVDIIISPRVRLINFFPQLLGIQIQLLLVLGQKLVELRVQHPDDLAALIADDCLCLLTVLLSVVKNCIGTNENMIF